MRIAIVAPTYPLRGGIAQFTSLMSAQLSKRGYEVKSFSFQKQYPNFIFPGKTQIDKSVEKLTVKSSEPVFIPYNPLSWGKTFIRIKNYHPAIVIFQWWVPLTGPGYGFIDGLLKHFCAIPSLFIVHNVIPHEKWPGGNFWTRFAFRKGQKFFLLSANSKDELYRFYPQARNLKVTVSPHPLYDCYKGEKITPQKAKQRLNIEESKVLLFFGNIKPYKGLKTLLDAFSRVTKKLKDVRLIIAGEVYGSAKEYFHLIKELNIGDKVTFPNKYIPNEEVGFYFQAADAIVLPYLSATQSGVVQIAFHFEKPVITTDVGSLSEVILNERTGLLVKPGDPKELERTILKFYQKKTLAKTLTQGIREVKTRYSWDNFINKLDEAIRE